MRLDDWGGEWCEHATTRHPIGTPDPGSMGRLPCAISDEEVVEMLAVLRRANLQSAPARG